MKFRLIDLKLPASIYAIYLFDTSITVRDFLAIASKLRYYANLEGIAWLAVYSTTDSRTSQIKYSKSGNRGRPKKCVYGKTVNPHCHLSLIGSPTKSAYSTALKFKKAVDKNSGRKLSRIVSKGNQFDARVWIGYCLRQADIFRSGGDFDFQKEAFIL